MSVTLLLELWKSKLPITPSQRLVLHCLAYYTNEQKNNLCFPSYHSIADITGLSRRGVIKIIEQLCFTGLLVKEGKNNKSNHYKICLPLVNLVHPLVNPVHHTSEPSSPDIINDLIIDLKENIIKEKSLSEISVPQTPPSPSLRSTAKDVLSFLRKKTGRNYQPVDSNLKPIIYLLKDGITAAQCRQVIVRKQRDWGHDPKFEKYLRPSTLFNKTNFYSKYLPECITEEDKKKIMESG